MGTTIAILDDEPERIAAMETLLHAHFPGFSVRSFDNAPDFIAWIPDWWYPEVVRVLR